MSNLCFRQGVYVRLLFISYLGWLYNQQSFSKDLHHTRTERWEAGLVKFPPDVPPERSLDICLPRTLNRIIQKGGQLRFEGQSYRDDYLSSHAGESVFLRFNPSNITSVLVYQEQGYEEHFLARACIQNFHEESLSLADAKAILRRRQKRRSH
ncbi:Mu transposase C-terminal domain-containing protein [Leptolyngbya sp. NK1-12]|uniref:Mu transposase C-terminal domain-containing protein n=1 Tax=Leptolyngbya sp. NK1-12 TaxID=2547451 RepID=A0AA96WJD7_9CYAN|nr:Mu transposase C-terminal domain-containing protein [Leptolyngbya sp. NK1-12]